MTDASDDPEDEAFALGLVTDDRPRSVCVAYPAERNSTKDRRRPADIAEQGATLDAVNVV